MVPAEQRLAGTDLAGRGRGSAGNRLPAPRARPRRVKPPRAGEARGTPPPSPAGRRRSRSAPFDLGMIERHVGMLEQGIAVVAVARRDGKADRAGHLDRGAVDVHRHDDGAHHLARHAPRQSRLGAAAEQNELVAAETGDRAAAVDDRAQLPGDGAEHPVAGRMAEGVVDLLELVEVEPEHGELLVLSAIGASSACSRSWKARAILEAGHCVVAGEPLEPGGQPLLLLGRRHRLQHGRIGLQGDVDHADDEGASRRRAPSAAARGSGTGRSRPAGGQRRAGRLQSPAGRHCGRRCRPHNRWSARAASIW